MAPIDTIVIDGTTLEGGGQIVRLAIGVSALANQPVRINNIRWGRSGGGGLKSQHLTAISCLADWSNADVEGLELKSPCVVFNPGSIERHQQWRSRTLPDGRLVKEISIDLKTPGAISLVLQALLPFLIFRGDGENSTLPSGEPISIVLNFHGGTNVSGSPSIDYVTQVLLPNLALLGIEQINLMGDMKRGWSTGRPEMGSATVIVTPLPVDTKIPGTVFSDRGKIVKISATMVVPEAARSMMRKELMNVLFRRFREVPDLEIVVDEDSGHMKRLYLLLVARTDKGHHIGRDWLYDSKGPKDLQSLSKAVRVLVKKVCDSLEWELSTSASFDIYMEDELVVYQALAKGESGIQHSMLVGNFANRQPSLHTRTARYVMKELLDVDFEYSQVATRCIGFAGRNRSAVSSKLAEQEEEEGQQLAGLQKLSQVHLDA